MRRKFYYIIITTLVLLPYASVAQGELTLWYDKPAQRWEETLPLGNGRLGMMPDGGVDKENIVLNDITLWSGGPEQPNKKDAYKSLPAIRQLLLDGKNDEAQALVNKNFVCEGKGSGSGIGAEVPFGCYQMLGDLSLTFVNQGTNAATDYKRSLSLHNATATCSYVRNGVTYTREYLTSFGDDVALIRLSASKPHQLSLRVGLSRPERFETRVTNNILQMNGQLTNGTDGNGMRYTAMVAANVEGGRIAGQNNELVISDATEVLLVISMGTDFKKSFYPTIAQTLEAAIAKPFKAHLSSHTTHYQQFFNRVKMHLEGKTQTDLPTDKRLSTFYKYPSSDNGIPVLFFQFGRYLTICSTRVGWLPPNLQGLWANQVQTPWNGDYHLDVNVQMNHWPVEVSNLSELNLPLADLVQGLVKPGEETAKSYYNAEGWVAHVITNIWGYTAPGEDASWGATNSGSGWLCNNLWEHYAFTLDKNYLRRIYPILKGSAQFYSSVLMAEPQHGWLVTAPSVSPENWFNLPNGKQAGICMGPTIDNQITRELFTNVINASEILGQDESFRHELKKKLDKLPPPAQISSDGRVMEWLQEYKEADPKHRHVSHLYGLYPASLITPERTPEFAAAARKTLDTRGDDSPGWSKAYKILFWARLHDGNRAFSLLKELLLPTSDTSINYDGGGGTYNNMLSAGPPFQIDGNFGGTAGIAEMLLQSHEDFIDLLPALPDTWKAGGEVKGMKARGNFTIDMKWKDGRIVSYAVRSPQPRKVKVRINGEKKEVMAEKK